MVEDLPEEWTDISIHALREEGDGRLAHPAQGNHRISIHALREEGDLAGADLPPPNQNFYPRPPRGGRHNAEVRQWQLFYFYPRPPRGGRPTMPR